MDTRQASRLGRAVIVLSIVGILSGCSVHLTATAFPVTPGTVPIIRGGTPVTVTNAQDATEEVSIASLMGGHLYVSLNQFTEEAVGILKAELQNSNMEIAFDGVKEVKLAVTRVERRMNFATMSCIVSLQVKTGDGYVAEFVRNNPSPVTLERACGGAVTRTVEDMLNDPKVGAYLAK